jgi:[ribosomal protein S5]-alanine N-acetyltransferase
MNLPVNLEIHTPRLHIRAVQEADLSALLRINGNDEVTQYLPFASWQTMDDAHAGYQRVLKFRAANEMFQWVICLRGIDSLLGMGSLREGSPGSAEKVIGWCLMFAFDEPSQRAEFGYVLGREFWGAGYMFEAMAALVQHGFDHIGLRRLEAEIDARNTASARLLERLGFEREGLRRGRLCDKGIVSDSVVYGLLKSV